MNITKIEIANNCLVITTYETTFIIPNRDCFLRIFDLSDHYNPVVRTMSIHNKHTQNQVSMFNAATLDPTSTYYNADLDIYFNNLISIFN